jgi:hypothetical protein
MWRARAPVCGEQEAHVLVSERFVGFARLEALDLAAAAVRLAMCLENKAMAERSVK